jgi:hypothetical protein
MKELIKAIYAKNAGSTLDTLIGGRIFHGAAPKDTAFPYVVYFRVTGSQEWTFTENFDCPLIQFSVFSNSPSSLESATIADAVQALYNECSLSVTSETFLYMWLVNTVGPMLDDSIIVEGSDGGWACHLDFDVRTLL